VKLYRPSTVLVGVLFVLLGGLTRLADPDQVYDDTTRQVVSGTIGQELKLGGSTVTVTRMKFAKSYLANESDAKAIETNGVFVAVEYDSVRGTDKPGTNWATLTADGGTVYKPAGGIIADGVEFAEPGFAQTGALVFEVNPADLKGLTLKIAPVQFFTVLAQDVAVDLGVPDDKIAAQLVDRATSEYLLPRPVTRVAQ
jgi:hypothetical protein